MNRAKRKSFSIPALGTWLAASLGTSSSAGAIAYDELESRVGEAVQPGVLILNADDWGRTPETTDRIFDCVRHGSVSSTSAMVFMEDSERAAGIAREHGVDAGLHLNFTSTFSSPDCPTWLVERQHEISRYLRRHPLARVMFHPWLAKSFEDLVAAQIDEFRRLYHRAPERLDGHHHMHLCANVLYGGLLPAGTVVRRNFSFLPGEKSLLNRLYRKSQDRRLAKRHRVVDFFYSIAPIEPLERLEKIFAMARHSAIEVETHPVNPEEYEFLMGGGIERLTQDLTIASRFSFAR